jgi:predicted dehydrogenase
MEWVKADRIGTVKAVQANFGFIGNNDPQGRLFNPDLGGGALLDVGIYPVLIANHIAQGAPISISAQAQFTETGVDASTFITAKYENGMLALLGASIEMNLINHLVIYGENGRIEVPLFWMADEATCFSQNEVEVFRSDDTQKQGYQYEAQAVCRAIADGRIENETVSHGFTLELMETLDRIRAEVGLKYKQDLL